jgi:predicted RNA-binding Zn ribbon-like protein
MVNRDLVLDYVNTLELRPYVEELDSPAALGAWLRERGLLAENARVTTADLKDALELREAVRTLLAAHNEVPGDVSAASAVVDDALCRANLCVRFLDGNLRLEPKAGGVRGALGGILAEVATAMTDGSWERMKACRADDCLWAYYDTAKNQSRAWCSMSSCGNRAKVRAYRARHAHV